MDFKHLILNDTEKKYQEMLNKTTKEPFGNNITITTNDDYKESRDRYVYRLQRETIEFNNALSNIQQKRASRIRRERADKAEKERIKAEKEFKRKQNAITIACLIPIIALIVYAILMIENPISVFSKVRYGWIIAIYIIAFIVCFISAIVFFRRANTYVDKKSSQINVATSSIKTRGVIYILGSITFLVCMIVGMSASTIKISSANELDSIMCLPGYEKKTYVLTEDIDYDGETCKMWGKIIEFEGAFDGNNHKISNVKVETTTHHVYHEYYISNPGATYTNGSPVECAGFVVKNRGTIKNIHFDNIEMKYTPTARFNMVGLVAGENTGKIENCILTNCQIIEKRSEISDNKKFRIIRWRCGRL